MKKSNISIFFRWSLLLLFCVGVMFLLVRMDQDKKFSVTAWAGEAKHERYKYLRDLKEHYLFHGQTRLQVYQLLGKPDSVIQNNTIVVYIIGGGGFMHANRLLDLRFSDDTLIQIYVRTD